ncbi:MAG: AAA family ATPase [Synergistaceae bacterium]|nr:AAA family ATPase [Synergistaceae bacterium]
MNSILVRNLGPIGEIFIDLLPNFFAIIGAQASGKSTLAKIIYFCKKIRDYAVEFVGEDDVFYVSSSANDEECYVSFLRKLRDRFMKIFDTTEYSCEDFYVKYIFNGTDFVELTLGETKYVDFQFSQEIEAKLKKLFNVVRQFNVEEHENTQNEIEIRKFWQEQLARKRKLDWVSSIFSDSGEEILYIPAGRGIFSILATQFNAIDNLNFDLPVKDFIEKVRIAKSRFGKNLTQVVEDYSQTCEIPVKKHDINLAKDLIKLILKADYINDTDGEKLYIDSKHCINLIYGSSGQQEVLWILLMMFSLIMEHKKAFIILEEPEANVYPDAQKDIVKLVALTLSSTQSQIFITTHSPYILTSANLLIHSGRVENHISALDKEIVIPQQFRMNPKDSVAYKLSKADNRYKLENICDSESGMFNASEIDKISNIILEDTDKLIDLELKYGL